MYRRTYFLGPMYVVLLSSDLGEVALARQEGGLGLPQAEHHRGEDERVQATDKVQHLLGLSIQPQAWSVIGDENEPIAVTRIHDLTKILALQARGAIAMNVGQAFDMHRKGARNVDESSLSAIDQAIRFCCDLGTKLTIDEPLCPVRAVRLTHATEARTLLSSIRDRNPSIGRAAKT